MTPPPQRPLHVLTIQPKEILMKSVTSQGDADNIVKKRKFPISLFPKGNPDLSVDLFTHINAGEALRLGWSRAAQRGKGKGGGSRELHGWVIVRAEEAESKGGTVKHTPDRDNRHHISIYPPANKVNEMAFRYDLADMSRWCPHPGSSFRTMITEAASKDPGFIG